jgi:hypothetical protein
MGSAEVLGREAGRTRGRCHYPTPSERCEAADSLAGGTFRRRRPAALCFFQRSISSTLPPALRKKLEGPASCELLVSSSRRARTEGW